MKRTLALILTLAMLTCLLAGLGVTASADNGSITVTFDGIDGAEGSYVLTDRVTVPSTVPTKEGYTFIGWSSYEPGDFVYVSAPESFTADSLQSDVTFYPVWVESSVKTADFTGRIVDSDGKGISDAWVCASGNGGTFGNTYTDGNGDFTFSNLPQGVYNIQILDSATGKLVLYTFNAPQENGGTFSLPEQDVFVMTVKGGTFVRFTMFGGLDTLIEDEAAAGDATVLSLTAFDKWVDDDSDEIMPIKKASVGQKLSYFKIQLSKAVNGGDKTEITETKHPLTFIVPFDTTQKNVKVYSAGAPVSFEKLSAAPTEPADGTYFVDTENRLVYIFTSHPGLFAVGRDLGTLYNITVNESEEGYIYTSAEAAEAGESIQVMADSYGSTVPDTVTVIKKDGNSVPVTVDEIFDGWFFEMPDSDVTVTVAFKEYDRILDYFTDIPSYAYYHDAVLWAAENDIASGIDDYLFGPDGNTTRAQMVTFLWRTMGYPEAESAENPFTDVSADAYCYDAVLWAVENGITTGMTETEFAPDAPVNRAQAVTFLSRLADSAKPDENAANPFADVPEDAYYRDAVLWAVNNGITNGTGETTFTPDAVCTRAQVVTFIYRFIEG